MCLSGGGKPPPLFFLPPVGRIRYSRYPANAPDGAALIRPTVRHSCSSL
ncbi:hypothetical protein CKO_02484 [Citrobacter koseri ATCC BAA-895]|uniref:Uncharacterized protein n=1 Tax=Citrobacter koseri (strain ATCC BAA-895 / CDC 4225-83 / SGSC4696) TaxID=290338 RepID=A8AJD7_CITK8|nr:hypothetical protein CKO_02484 [Citrobacter koseri ATCC BAA-895]